ncbi:glycosyltransferase family 4 protein [Hymenobacter jejuensis]|uniref:Glycosyltransferase family 4 protein n=2 Tax=Hymenobacter jejuensis TaxID=2502781 RepID=A0A5B8A6J9_9BACT|nr:glycosyltransferase family 4 protein [Hymenobacter jejuensis]
MISSTEHVSAFSGATKPNLGILCLSRSFGGLEMNTLKFAGWLRERGWNLTLFVLTNSPLHQGAQHQGIACVSTARHRKYFDVTGARWLAHNLKRLQIPVLILTQNREMDLVSLTKLRLGKSLKLIYQQHMQLGPPKRDVVHSLRFMALDAWLSPLNLLAAEVESKTRFNPDRVYVVPIGINLDRFVSPGVTTVAARQQLQLPAQTPLLGILGRIDAGKGQDFVVSVLHHLRTENKLPVELVIMGEPTKNEGDAYWNALQQQVQELDLAQVVHFRPFSEHAEVFFQAIDVFVLASANETYGMVTIEAMASARPVVATRSGGTTEIIQDEITGLLYPPRDLQACAQCVARYIHDPEQAHQIAQLAQREAQRKYSHHRQCELTEAIIYSIL